MTLSSCGRDDSESPAVTSGNVSLTLSFTAPASSTGSSLVVDDTTLLAETAVSCPCVVSTLDGTVLVDSTSCKAVAGAVTVSIPATSTGIVATCLPTGEGYIGAICTTDAVTADMSCSVNSQTTTSLGTYLATCQEASGSPCLDPATAKPTGSLVIPNINAGCLLGALGETIQKGDSTA